MRPLVPYNDSAAAAVSGDPRAQAGNDVDSATMRFAFDDDAPVPRTVIVIAVCFCAGLALGFRGGLVHFLVAMACAALIAPFLLGFLGRWMWLRLRRNSSRKDVETIGSACVIAAIFVAAPIVSLVPGRAIGSFVEHRTMDWATESVVPAIESYRSKHGTYPASLGEIVGLPSGPMLVLDEDLHYAPMDYGFCLNLWTGMFSGWVWTSRDREWRYCAD